jgi:hypothetical protein
VAVTESALGRLWTASDDSNLIVRWFLIACFFTRLMIHPSWYLWPHICPVGRWIKYVQHTAVTYSPLLISMVVLALIHYSNFHLHSRLLSLASTPSCLHSLAFVDIHSWTWLFYDCGGKQLTGIDEMIVGEPSGIDGMQLPVIICNRKNRFLSIEKKSRTKSVAIMSIWFYYHQGNRLQSPKIYANRCYIWYIQRLGLGRFYATQTM